MRKLFAVLLGITMLGAGACGNDDDNPTVSEGETSTTARASFPAGSTMARLRDAGSVKVGVKFDQPGFGLKNPTTGEIEGFDVEIAEKIAAAIGSNVKVEFVESVSKNREPFIQDGTVDFVVATYTINDTRKQVVDFAGPYFVARQDIMVKADNTAIKRVTDLNGKKVCTVKGSTSATNLTAQAPQSQVTLFDTYSQCAEAMTDGRVEAVTTDNTILAGLVKDSDGAFKLVEAPFSNEPYGIGVKKGDDVFRDFINDTLEEMFDNGDWDEAFEATLGAIGLKTPDHPKIDRYTASSGTTGTTVSTGSGGSGATTTTLARTTTTS